MVSSASSRAASDTMATSSSPTTPTAKPASTGIRHKRAAASPRLAAASTSGWTRSEEHTSELQSQSNLVCRLLLEKKKQMIDTAIDAFDQRHAESVRNIMEGDEAV